MASTTSRTGSPPTDHDRVNFFMGQTRMGGRWVAGLLCIREIREARGACELDMAPDESTPLKLGNGPAEVTALRIRARHPASWRLVTFHP